MGGGVLISLAGTMLLPLAILALGKQYLLKEVKQYNKLYAEDI